MKRLLAMALLVAACGGSASPTPTPTATRTFDLAAVKAAFTEECASDDLFCTQVDIDGLTANGTILNVPTTLAAEARDRATAICEQVALMDDLGFETVGVLNRDGGNAAACSVD